MNKFVTSALALTVAGSLANAGVGDNEWLELDREISSLAAQPVMGPAQGGIDWSALIRVGYAYSDDDVALDPGTGEDLLGAKLYDIDLGAMGQVGDYAWRISGDFDGGSDNFGDLTLEDAYVNWSCYESIGVLLGNHKPMSMRSANVAPENLLFQNRTAIGSLFDLWDNGVKVHGSFEDMLRYCVSMTNGSNGIASDQAYCVRVEYLLGEGAGGAEGALGAGEDLALTIGGFWANFDDRTAMDGDDQIYGGDVWGTVGPVGFGAEVLSIDDGFDATTGNGLATDEDFLAGGAGTGLVSFDADSTPWDVTGSFLVNEELEVGARYESTDSDDDTNLITIGLNWYQSGHNAKWQASVTDISSDTDVEEGTIWQVGLVVGSTGPTLSHY
jgi:hypothetical protein